ncbi:MULTISPECIES: hypothetical protein [Subtercola]|nr:MULTISPECIES: hypothetical protein [Subtercola]MEA9985397.1 hypothetical protein [Subtercola sp. RTI3]
MSLTRKRQKALKRLRSSAEDLWFDQQSILDRANHVAREAKLQLGELTKEEVVPRVKTATDSIAPTIARNIAAAKVAGDQVRSKWASDVLPALGSTLTSAADVFHVSDNTSVKKAIAKVAPKPAKKSSHLGAYAAIITGTVALVGIGYAVWQTFRADDELWISEDEIDATPAS